MHTTRTSTLTDLECGLCAKRYPADQLINLCPACGKPLLARYDLERAAATMTPAALRERSATLWRYQEVLPVLRDDAALSLGEGWTPLLHAARLGEQIGMSRQLIKDKSLNPTGSFKARGLALAVSRAYELGAQALGIPSAGNAAGAAAAYAALAGLPISVFMPADVPLLFRAECAALGAEVTLVDGLITDCGAQVREGAAAGTAGSIFQHLEGAVPDRGQKDDGLRAGRAAGLEAARRDHLSHRRRHRPGRHVESL